MGFPQLAKVMASDQDHETYVFRSFNQIAARTLLHLQSELAILEREQQRLDDEAVKCTSNRHVQMMLTRWLSKDDLSDEAQNEPEVKRRIELADKIAEKLERYYRLLGFQKQVATYDRPSGRVMKAYRTLFYGSDGETPELYEPLQSKALSSDSHDYVALHPPIERDLLSQFMRDHLPATATVRAPIELPELCADHSPEDLYSNGDQHVKQYESRWIVRLATFCSIVIAALLLIASILLLYYVRSPNARLGLVLAFIVLFAVGVSISTAATRDGVFASTAAYAAVLIVFVSGNLGITNTGTLSGLLTGTGSGYSLALNGTFG